MPHSPWPWHWKWHRRVLLKEWRHAVWEKSSPVIVAVIILVAASVVVNREIQTTHYSALAAQYGAQAARDDATIKRLTMEQITSSNRHHDQNVLSQSEIKAAEQIIIDAQKDHAGTLNDIATLETEVSQVINGLPAADRELTLFAAYSVSVNTAICNDIVVVAAKSGIPLQPCPAVPKFAPLGG